MPGANNKSSIIQVGQNWPPKGHKQRIEKYKLMDDLYKGDRNAWRSLLLKFSNEAAYSYNLEDGSAMVIKQVAAAIRGDIESKVKHYKLLNLLRFIARKFGQLVFNKPIRLKRVQGKDDSVHAVNRIIRENKLHKKAKNACSQLLVNGDVFFKLRIGAKASYKNANEQAIIEAVPPEQCFPEFAEGSFEMEALNIVVPKKITLDGNKTVDCLAVERHEPGRIIYQAFLIDGVEIKREYQPDEDMYALVWPNIESPEQDTLVDRLLVWHIGHQEYKDFWGESEFYDSLEVFNDLNQQLGGLSHINRVASSPKLRIPENMVTRDKSGNFEARIEDVIPITPSDQKDNSGWLEISGPGPNYIKEFIRDEIDFLCMLTSAPRSLFRTIRDSDSSESGVAIEKKAASTSLAAWDMIGDFKDAFEEILFYAQELEVKHGLVVELSTNETEERTDQDGDGLRTKTDTLYGIANYETFMPELDIQYGIVPDTEKALANIEKKRDLGLITRDDAVLEANPELNPENLEEYLQRLDEEESGRPENVARSRMLDGLNVLGDGDDQNQFTTNPAISKIAQAAAEAKENGQVT